MKRLFLLFLIIPTLASAATPGVVPVCVEAGTANVVPVYEAPAGPGVVPVAVYANAAASDTGNCVPVRVSTSSEIGATPVVVVSGSLSGADALLMETGSRLLLESGDRILLE